MPAKKPLKVAIVADWLTNMGGAERVVLALSTAFNDAPIYTSVYAPQAMPLFKDRNVRTTYLQKLPPRLRERHQLFPLLRANAFRRLDLTEYDVVISSASAEAKAVRVRPGALHVCYCHTPTRYYWSHYHDYLASPGFGKLNAAVRVALPALVHFMRRSDLKAVQGVDYFIANSAAVAERIHRYYGREADIIYPPVDMARFRTAAITGEREGFIVVGRQVPYKRMDLAVQACTALKIPLTLYGNGPDHAKLQSLAGSTVKFVTDASDKAIAGALSRAIGFINPQDEDFGITQIEAMAAGCPVIAFAKGGALDSVVEGKTGTFFSEQTVTSLCDALKRFQTMRFAPKVIQAHAEQFSEERFVREIQDFVSSHRPIIC